MRMWRGYQKANVYIDLHLNEKSTFRGHHTFAIHIGIETQLHLFHSASFYHIYWYIFAQKCIAHVSNIDNGKQRFSKCIFLYITKIRTLLECGRDGDKLLSSFWHIVLERIPQLPHTWSLKAQRCLGRFMGNGK